jgi:hypothetical protein
MDAFSFVFSLFGLLLGLALAEVLSGLGTAIEARHRIRIGWLLPLLALLTALDIVSFWMVAWSIRAAIPINFFSLAAGLAIFGLYYLIAQLVFPGELDRWRDFDAYYFAHRKWIVGGIWLCNVLAMLGESAIGLKPFATPSVLGGFAAFSLGAVGMMFLPGKRANLAALLYQISLYPVLAELGTMGTA